MNRRRTIEELKTLRESEDKVEFKEAKNGTFSYNGGDKAKPADRRRCILGYVVAFCNEGGGSLVFGMHDKYPHKVVGTSLAQDGLGELENKIYRDIGIRPTIYELYEDEAAKRGRVLVIDVPGRPVGRVFKFEDVPLMRVGEELRPMSDEMLRAIFTEQEQDFSAEVCREASLSDLSSEAITILKQKYAAKQGNPAFLSLPDTQVLSDLRLVTDHKVTYAALILLGREERLQQLLPQSRVILEYRKSEGIIPYSNRIEYQQPFYLMIDQLWHDINLRNDKLDVNEGSYIFNIPSFSEEVIREAINNAVAHRDYRRMGETFILQYADKLVVKNAGGFPLGVTPENLLRVQSTPRNRLLADVLAKTGIVERSGQGVDKIYRNMLSEGKDEPDYSHSDEFKVELHLSAVIKDVAFAQFLTSEQRELPEEDRLSVFDVLALSQIKEDKRADIESSILESLLKRGMIERHGRTKGVYYVLSKSYYEYAGKEGEYTRQASWTVEQASSLILGHLSSFPRAKMGAFEAALQGHMTRRQVKVVVDLLVRNGDLLKLGKGPGTYYEISPQYLEKQKLLAEAVELGLKALAQSQENGQDLSKKPEPGS
jgi:ATP-dependent DNA helicase recG-related protein